jgi:periplasmic protein TonB
MNAPAIPWFGDHEPRDVLRWSLAAAIVVCMQAGLVGAYLLWQGPEQIIGDDSPVVAVELAPIDSVADATQRDVAPAAEEMVEHKAVPEQDKEPTQPKVEEPPPPALTMPDVALPVQKPVEKAEQEAPPAPRTAAPVIGGSPAVAPSWQAALLKRLQNYKRYPRSAQARGEQGVVLLHFKMDRNGRVLARRILRSSGSAELDGEVLAMIERAQPLPAFPASMTQDELDLTVPIRFSLR